VLVAGERRSCAGAGDTVAFTMPRPPTMNKHAKAIHCDMVFRLSTWSTCDKRPTPARLIPTGRRASGYGEFNSDRVRANPGTKIFHSPQLSTLRWARIAAASANSGTRSPAAKGDESGDLFQLLYNGNLIQSA
jgi:hypothetical protein